MRRAHMHGVIYFVTLVAALHVILMCQSIVTVARSNRESLVNFQHVLNFHVKTNAVNCSIVSNMNANKSVMMVLANLVQR